MPYRLALNGHKNTSFYKEMAKNPIYNITGNFFLKTCLFKIPVQPPNMRNTKTLLFILIDRS